MNINFGLKSVAAKAATAATVPTPPLNCTANLVIVFETFKHSHNLKAWLRFAREAQEKIFFAACSYCMYSFSRCSVELRDTNTNCVIGSLAICYGIRLWLVWAVVYVVTFAQAY